MSGVRCLALRLVCEKRYAHAMPHMGRALGVRVMSEEVLPSCECAGKSWCTRGCVLAWSGWSLPWLWYEVASAAGALPSWCPGLVPASVFGFRSRVVARDTPRRVEGPCLTQPKGVKLEPLKVSKFQSFKVSKF